MRAPTPRDVNHTAILRVIRDQGPTTRPELEQITGLGRRIVADRVQELIEGGLASEGALALSTGGRMPRRIELRVDCGLVCVAEMNLHHTAVGIADLGGNLLATREIPTDVASGPGVACARIAAAMSQLVADTGHDADRLWGVGIGVTAPVEVASGRIAPGELFEGTSMAGWDGYPVRERMVELLQRPVWVSNEANLMALGEFRGGRGRGHRDLVFAKLGPSIGGGLVLGGRLQHGLAAGEIGHLTVPDDEQRLCWCGGRGCLFTFVEEKVLLAEADGRPIDPDAPPTMLPDTTDRPDALVALVAAAAAGDPTALAILTRAGRRIGAVLGNVVTLLGPELLVIGGTLVAAGSPVPGVVQQVIKDKVMRVAQGQLAIEVSPLSDRAGLIGAAYLVSDALLSPEALAIWLPDRSPQRHVGELLAAVEISS